MSNVNYKKYGLSKARYDELSAFARQYPEFLAQRRQILSDSGAVEKNGIAAADLQTKIEMIEQCVKVACKDEPGLIPYMLSNVTGCKNRSYEKVVPPIYRDGFYKRRWIFFIELSKMKK